MIRDSTRSWRARPTSCASRAATSARCRTVPSTAPYLDELRLDGRYDSARAIAALHMRLSEGASPEGDVDPQQLLATFSAFADTPLPHDLGAYVERAELGSTDELLQAVMLAVRAAQALLGVELRDAGTNEAPIVPDPPSGSPRSMTTLSVSPVPLRVDGADGFALRAYSCAPVSHARGTR